MGRGGRPVADHLLSIPLHRAPVKSGSISRPSGLLPPGVGTEIFQAEEYIPWPRGDSLLEGLCNCLNCRASLKIISVHLEWI